MWGGLGLQGRVAGVGSGAGRIWGFKAGRRGRREQSVLYSHSLNPLWNRSMKWHSPVQKRKVKRQVMREDIAVSISAPTPRGGQLESHGYIPSHCSA